jgi:predicted TIM-barrel fold metal-dependent hydrolase
VPAVPIIDAHIHTDFSGEKERSSGIAMTQAELERALSEAGVVGAVAHTHRYDEEWVDMRSHGIIHCCGIDKDVDVPRLEAGLASGRYRCIKIYLGYVHQYAYDPAYEPAYALAERFGVPVVFHTGDTYSTTAKLKYADPLTVDEVAVDHPKVTFVLAHLGNPWIASAAEVAYKNPNVVLDGSALLVGDLSELSVEDRDRYVVEPLRWLWGFLEDPQKLMFGSDWPLVDIGDYAAVFRLAIPPEHHRAVFHDNAARVFKLEARGE